MVSKNSPGAANKTPMDRVDQWLSLRSAVELLLERRTKLAGETKELRADVTARQRDLRGAPRLDADADTLETLCAEARSRQKSVTDLGGLEAARQKERALRDEICQLDAALERLARFGRVADRLDELSAELVRLRSRSVPVLDCLSVIERLESVGVADDQLLAAHQAMHQAEERLANLRSQSEACRDKQREVLERIVSDLDGHIDKARLQKMANEYPIALMMVILDALAQAQVEMSELESQVDRQQSDLAQKRALVNHLRTEAEALTTRLERTNKVMRDPSAISAWLAKLSHYGVTFMDDAERAPIVREPERLRSQLETRWRLLQELQEVLKEEDTARLARKRTGL